MIPPEGVDADLPPSSGDNDFPSSSHKFPCQSRLAQAKIVFARGDDQKS
jgi:hypothetical protein